jgi:ActR/RegA family two-component response regulator
MDDTNGNKSAAARLLGVHLRTFQRRWDKFRPR